MQHYMLFLLCFFYILFILLTVWMVAHGVWVLPRGAVTICDAT
jgi:hypothetical protein